MAPEDSSAATTGSSARLGWWFAALCVVLGTITVSGMQGGAASDPASEIGPAAPPLTYATAAGPTGSHSVTGFLSLVAPAEHGRAGVQTSAVDRFDGRLACRGVGEYHDLGYDTPVRVFDAQGVVVAVGALGYGRAMDEQVSAAENVACLFPLTVTEVPDGRGPYRVEVAQRGSTAVEQAEDGSLRAFVMLGSG